MTITQWDSDSAFVAMYVATGLIANQQPQSLMIIGEADAGKSALLARFRDSPGIIQVTNTYGNELKAEVAKKHPHHIIVDEFVALTAHTDSAVDSILTFLRQIISGDGGEEHIGQGTGRIALDFRGYRCGVITSMTNSQHSRISTLLQASGFDSRLNIFRLKRSDEERARVRHNVLHDDLTDLRPWKWNEWQRSRPAVRLNGEPMKVFHEYINTFFPETANRSLNQLKSMLASVAFLRKNPSVTFGDVAWLCCFHEYWTHLGPQPVLSPMVIQRGEDMGDEMLGFFRKHNLFTRR